MSEVSRLSGQDKNDVYCLPRFTSKHAQDDYIYQKPSTSVLVEGLIKYEGIATDTTTKLETTRV